MGAEGSTRAREHEGDAFQLAHTTMTVQGVINYLQTIEDKEQPIIWQFYLAKHFPIPPKKIHLFPEIAGRANSDAQLWASAYWLIDSIVEDVVNGKEMK